MTKWTRNISSSFVHGRPMAVDKGGKLSKLCWSTGTCVDVCISMGPCSTPLRSLPHYMVQRTLWRHSYIYSYEIIHCTLLRIIRRSVCGFPNNKNPKGMNVCSWHKINMILKDIQSLSSPFHLNDMIFWLLADDLCGILDILYLVYNIIKHDSIQYAVSSTLTEKMPVIL